MEIDQLIKQREKFHANMIKYHTGEFFNLAAFYKSEYDKIDAKIKKLTQSK